jgi:hypothetical protein
MSQINVNIVNPYSGFTMSLNHIKTKSAFGLLNVNSATGEQSYAEGYYTVASGNNSHAEGSETVASGLGSHAEGIQTIASGLTAHAEGSTSEANGDVSHAEGNGTKANGFASHSQGQETIAQGNYSHASGYNSKALSDISFIHSINSVVSGLNSAVLGGQNITGATSNTVYVPKLETAESGEGVIMKSPDGTRYKVTVANGGTLTVTAA